MQIITDLLLPWKDKTTQGTLIKPEAHLVLKPEELTDPELIWLEIVNLICLILLMEWWMTRKLFYALLHIKKLKFDYKKITLKFYVKEHNLALKMGHNTINLNGLQDIK